VNWFTKTMVLVLAAVWPLVTSHCNLEVLSNLTFLACGETAEADSHKDDACETDACAVVESGLYKIEERLVPVLPPLLAALFEVQLLTQTSDFICPTASIFPPPELPNSWQFSQRAVAPPRAPSFVS
jgi:hypothetical protein